MDLYEVLNVTATATLAELRPAFKRAALAAHPDKGGNKEAFHTVMVAFEISMDFHNL